MTVEAAQHFTPDETGYCLNCRRSRETHSSDGMCSIRVTEGSRRPATLRRFVTRGGELVEIDQPVRETR